MGLHSKVIVGSSHIQGKCTRFLEETSCSQYIGEVTFLVEGNFSPQLRRLVCDGAESVIDTHDRLQTALVIANTEYEDSTQI